MVDNALVHAELFDRPAATSSANDRVGTYSLQGLHIQWDNLKAVRDRLRMNSRLIMHWDPETEKLTNIYPEKTLQNVRKNREQLRPLLHLMKENKLFLPGIDGLIEEVRALYRCAKCACSYDTLYWEAWACRRLLSLAKNTLLHRKFLSEDWCHDIETF